MLYVIEVARIWDWYDLEEIFFYVHTTRSLAEGAGDLRGWCHLRLPQQHLPVPAPAGPGVVCGRVLHLLHPGSWVLLLDLAEWKYMPPRPFSIFQLVLSLLSVLLYVSAWSSGRSTSSAAGARGTAPVVHGHELH